MAKAVEAQIPALGEREEISGHNLFYSLYCKGTGPRDVRYLDGRTDAGDVVHSPHLGLPFAGTRWWIHLVQDRQGRLIMGFELRR